MRSTTMLALLAAAILACGPKSNPPAAAPTSTYVPVIKPAAASPESFGGLSLGLTEARVTALIGAPASKSPEMEEGASGLTLSDWHWPARGVTLSMAKGDGGWTINSITLVAPSEAKSVDGIGIGSTHADVMTAYGQLVATDTESNDARVTLGSVYGGVFFDFTDGKVSQIFVGAGAE